MRPLSSGARMIPTSTTTAPGFTQSALIRPATPAAETMSAARQLGRIRRPCAIVSVAFSPSSISASGRPTTFDSPTTATLAAPITCTQRGVRRAAAGGRAVARHVLPARPTPHSRSMERRRGVCTASGCRAPRGEAPRVHRWKPSASLVGQWRGAFRARGGALAAAAAADAVARPVGVESLDGRSDRLGGRVHGSAAGRPQPSPPAISCFFCTYFRLSLRPPTTMTASQA